MSHLFLTVRGPLGWIGPLLITAWFALAGWANEPADPGVQDPLVQRFLQDHCWDCHGAATQEGELRFDELHLEDQAAAPTWIRIVETLKFGQMPPPDQRTVGWQELRAVGDRIQTALEAAGHELDVDHRLSQPAYANLIDHQTLFDGSIRQPASSPPRLWRLHPQAYQSFLESMGRQLNEGGPLSHPFMVGDGKGLASNYAALAVVDSATLGQLMLNCRQLAIWQTTGFKRLKKDNRSKEMVERVFMNRPDSFEALIGSTNEPSPMLLEAAVEEEFRLVLRRDPNEAERVRYVELLNSAIEIGGVERGLQTMVMAVLLRPDAIFRMEMGLGESDQYGRRMLSPYELAHSIAYALTDVSPAQLLLGQPKPNDRQRRPQPPALMELADRGELESRDDVQRVVEQLWDNDAIEKPRVLQFFREFFGYYAAETVFKGDRADRSFATRFFVSDADRLVMHAVKQDRQVLEYLLTTEEFFLQWPGSKEEYDRRVQSIQDKAEKSQRKDLNYKYFVERSQAGLHPIPQANPTWRQTVRFYNLDERTWDYPLQQPFAMPAGQRAGILTHPAWLVAWSGNFENDPIRRGKWIREHLLADSVPDIPITVNAQVPEDHSRTLRDRLSVTRQEYCWQCHQKMDPLGLPFEAYTDFGRHRVVEGLGPTKALAKPDPKHAAPVVTAGQIIGSGDRELDGEVADVAEMMKRLAASPRTRQSFVRHVFRFWMGRNEMISDSPTLIAMEKAYVDQQGSFKAMVVALLTSDSFLYRK